MKARYLTVAITLLGAAWLQAQAVIRFEAASIKRNDSNGPGFLGVNGDRFTATNFPLRIFIRNAFRYNLRS